MTALSFPVVAAAQSNVVVFGVADASVRVVNGGNGTAYSVGSGGLAASRFGIRTQEDLGNGIAAGAWMEGTVNYNDGTGNSSRFWNRRATVSLLGPLGEVRLGHDLTPGYTSFGEFDTFGVSGLADQGKFYSTAFGSGIEATGLWARADNMISYFTPNNLGGFYLNLATAFGEKVPAKKYNGGRIGYASGPLNVTAAYSVFDGLKGNLKRSALAASYDFGIARLLASTVRNQYLSAARQVTQVGVVVPISPAASVRANYTRASESGALNGASIDPNHATQIAMGFTYDFSKRTTVYGTLVYLANKGTSAFNFGASQPPGSRLRGGELGVSHRF